MTPAEYDHALLALTIENATLRVLVEELREKLLTLTLVLIDTGETQEAA